MNLSRWYNWYTSTIRLCVLDTSNGSLLGRYWADLGHATSYSTTPLPPGGEWCDARKRLFYVFLAYNSEINKKLYHYKVIARYIIIQLRKGYVFRVYDVCSFLGFPVQSIRLDRFGHMRCRQDESILMAGVRIIKIVKEAFFQAKIPTAVTLFLFPERLGLFVYSFPLSFLNSTKLKIYYIHHDDKYNSEIASVLASHKWHKQPIRWTMRAEGGWCERGKGARTPRTPRVREAG